MCAAALRAVLGLHAANDQQLSSALTVAQGTFKASMVEEGEDVFVDPEAGSKYAWASLKHLYGSSGGSSNKPAWPVPDDDVLPSLGALMATALQCFEVRTLTTDSPHQCHEVPVVRECELESHTAFSALGSSDISNQSRSEGSSSSKAPTD